MMSRSSKSIAIFLLVGLAVGTTSIYILGVTMAMAIAIPHTYVSWFHAQGSLETGLLLADFALIFSTIGALSVALILTVHRFITPATRLSLAAFIAGVLAVAHVIVPLAYEVPLSLAYTRAWWRFGFEISLVVAALIAYFIASRLWPNMALKSN